MLSSSATPEKGRVFEVQPQLLCVGCAEAQCSSLCHPAVQRLPSSLSAASVLLQGCSCLHLCHTNKLELSTRCSQTSHCQCRSPTPYYRSCCQQAAAGNMVVFRLYNPHGSECSYSQVEEAITIGESCRSGHIPAHILCQNCSNSTPSTTYTCRLDAIQPVCSVQYKNGSDKR